MKNKTIIFLSLSIFILICFSLVPVLAVNEETKAVPQQVSNVLSQLQLPQGSFIDLKSGEQVFQVKILKFQIEKARSIEFYAKERNSLTSTYLGKASQVNNIWQYSWQTNSLPDGNYFVYSAVNNEYGEYFGPEISVIIFNNDKKELVAERVIQQVEENFAEKEKQVEGKIEETKNKTESYLEELKIFTMEKAKPELVEQAEKNIEKLKQEIPQEIKKAIDLPKVEERKEAKEQIVKKVDEVREETKKSIEQESLEEFENVSENISNQINSVLDKVDEIAEEKQENEKEKNKALWFVHKDPRRIESFNQENIVIEKVEVKEGNQLMIFGIGIPNTYVTIHIFSSPIVLAAKVDSFGRWEIILDKGIVDGKHTVYAAVADETGELLARSDTFVFAKSGANIFRILDISEGIKSPLQEIQKNFLILVFSLIILGLSLAFLIIGAILIKKTGKEKVS